MSADHRQPGAPRPGLVFLDVAEGSRGQGPRWPERAGGVVVVHSEGTAPPESFLESAVALMAADPRVASISWADSAVSALAGGPTEGHPALPARPRVAHACAPAGEAVAFSASAVTLVGAPTERDAPAGDLAAHVMAWSAAATARGLRHLWWVSGADRQVPSLLPTSEPDQVEVADPLSALAGLVDAHAAAHRRLRIGVEASRLGPRESGTQVATVAWIRALLDRSDVDSIALLDLPGGRLPTYAEALAGSPRLRVVPPGGPRPEVDVLWRPTQPDADALISVDRQGCRRLVVTVLDLIEFANPEYHADRATWHRRRAQVRRYLRQADVVTAISDDVMAQIEVEVPGLAPQRLRRSVLGVDQAQPGRPGSPPGSAPIAGLGQQRPFLLVLGNDFLHKNRDFAVRVWQRVCAEVPVDLVLAGLHVGRGSSRSLERVLIPGAAGSAGPAVHVAGHVGSGERDWLTANAAVVLYPTSAEGFGLVPHEAARLGTPTVYTRFGPLAQFLPADSGCPSWDEVAYADEALRLLRDPLAAQALCVQVLQRSAELTWGAAAEELVAAFRQALALPPQPWGLWERTGGVTRPVGDIDGPMAPMAPAEARRAAARIRFGSSWRARSGAARVRSRLGQLRRSLGR